MSFSSPCSRCGRSEGVRWTLDDAGDPWEWCPDCSQQLELLAVDEINSQVDTRVSVSASKGLGGLKHVSRIEQGIPSRDGLPF